MSFFDNPDWPSDDNEQASSEPGPPAGTIPSCLSTTAILVRSESLLVVINRFFAFRTGVQFTLEVQARDANVADAMLAAQFARSGSPTGKGRFRFGLQVDESLVWANFSGTKVAGAQESFEAGSDRPYVASIGSGGDSTRILTDYWMSRSAVRKSLRFYFDWLAFAVHESSASVDGAELDAGMVHALQLW